MPEAFLNEGLNMSFCGYNKPKRVLLISMPWCLLYQPSLSLGILKSVLLMENIPCDILYAAPYLLKYVKYDTYEWISKMCALDDFVFTDIFETEISQGQLDTISAVLQGDNHIFGNKQKEDISYNGKINKIIHLRKEIVPHFLDDLIEGIDFDGYSMVGFTCFFDQTIASLALARKIKWYCPDMFIAFGGISLAKPVGPALQRSFPEMDAVVYGDGEPVIVPLVEAACGERHLRDVPNITFRNDIGQVVESDVTSTIDLNDSPAPNYDDFFNGIKEMKDRYKIHLDVGDIPVESSRGCWWGQKVGCIFCSLDKNNKRYRIKSGDTVIRQLDQVHRRYKRYISSFIFSDRTMPPENYNDLLPKLKKRGAPYAIAYLTRPDISWEQFELISKSGVYRIIPGIESFSTPVLQLMKKGVTGIQNIFTLLGSMYHKLWCNYNIIWGFPNESVADYKTLAKLLPTIYHLVPPTTLTLAQLVRYSNLVEEPDKYGMEAPLKHHWRYNLLFSNDFLRRNDICLEHICYYYDDLNVRPFNTNTKPLYDVFVHQIRNWQMKFYTQKARLSYEENNNGISVYDSRYHDDPAIYKFGKEAKLLRRVMFGKICREKELFAAIQKKGVHRKTTRILLNRLCELRIVIKEGDKYLWIAFPEDFYKDNLAWFFAKNNPECNTSSAK